MPEVVVLYVVMHCEACAATVKRAVEKIPGVQSYRIDFYEQKVTVIGDVERGEVWRRIHKTGKRVTLIPKPSAPPKDQDLTEDMKEEPKEENKEAKKEIRKEENQERTEVRLEAKKQGTSEETTKGADTKEEVRADETKEKLATVVERNEENLGTVTELGRGGQGDAIRKRPERRREPDQWVPMFVSAPYYTIPSRFF